jgi:sulfite dehydrogenase
MDRRRFVALLASAGSFAAAHRALGGRLDLSWDGAYPLMGEERPAAPELVRYPQKTNLILLTDRPPQLETPLRYFSTDLTPNDAFFVRWHLAGIPTSVDLNTFRLEVGGQVEKGMSLSLQDLKTKFKPVSIVALAQCAGNSRSFFEPRVPGGQWGNGAMGNARWTGVRLKDLLDAAGVKAGAVQVGFRGLDVPVMAATPVFQKSLQIDKARDEDVMVAYAMNDAPLPMLNGFPTRLVVPGWFATYWVKSLSSITVLDQPLKTFWMDKAYRIPDNPDANEDSKSFAAKTVPINAMPIHSIFVRPQPGEKLRAGTNYTLQGVANDGGSGIRKVEFSDDDGKTWREANLGADLGKYSWRTWKAQWKPASRGDHRLMVRATTADGQMQRAAQWNRSGYQRDIIEHVDVVVS